MIEMPSTLVIDPIFVNYGSGYFQRKERGQQTKRGLKILKLQVGEITRKLKALGVSESIIAQATDIPLPELKTI